MRRKNLVALAGGFAAVLIGMFLLARIHPFGDPALFAGERGTDIEGARSLPGNVQAVLLNKCADCHGRGVRAPLYGHFAPASWLMEWDVTRARTAFDFSRWAEYSADRKDALRSHIAFEARKGTMPPFQYVAIHRSARLTQPEVRILEAWAAGSAGVADAADARGAGDAGRGKAVFEKRCTGCHALTQDREGPRLHDVFGRRAASVAGFNYSEALQKVDVRWDRETLNRWLTDPDAVAPGTDMTFRLIRPEERADVIEYLRQQAGR